MQKFGFDFGDPYYTFDGLQFAFRVCTLENVYGINPDTATSSMTNGRLTIETGGYQYAGGQKTCPGTLKADMKFSARTRDFFSALTSPGTAQILEGSARLSTAL